ncbi:MAG: zinc-ribbon domain-containing protein [Clostridiales bacterium]|nr:zinc-ribbon domain-containing protein [Clostridiales bacterium]
MAFCTNCGAKLPDGSRFCTECGAAIAASAPATPAEPEKKYTPEAPAEPAIHPDSVDAPMEYTAPDRPTQQSYTPPTQGSYTPPTQGGYTPPTQGSYTPPTQQGYTPPTQQGYQPTQQGGGYSYNANTANAYTPGAKAGKAPKAPRAPKAKSGRSKAPFIIGGAVLVFLLLIVLLIRGCTGAVKDAFDPNLGVYNATTAEMFGMEMDVTDVWEGGVSIELKAKDKCVFTIDGEQYNIKWTLDGSDIRIKGKGLDCEGTLNRGVLVLQDVMDMGVNLTFQKEGGFSDNMLDGDGMTSSDGEIGEDGYTAAQRKWNGAWYGSFQVVEQKNFDYLSDGAVYDALMVIDLGTDNKGTFDLYVFNDYDAPAAAGECEATETSLTATSVEMLGQDLDSVYNWMLLPRQDYTDQYCMGDTFEQDEYYMEFMVFMKPWGASWDKEIADGYNLLPPAMDEYNDLIAEGEMPPVGEAPIGYAGAEAQGGTAEAPVENTTETPAQSAAPAEGFDSGTITETVSDYSKDTSIDVSVTLPESGWKLSHELTTMYLYNVDDPEHLFSGDPRIQFDIYPSSDKLNYYEKNYENLKDEGTRTIGGVELKARSYKNVGMQWTEYYGEVPGGGWLSIKISKVDIGAGSEGDAVLNSISFK